MNVRTLCLAILYEREATGYEIRRLCVEGECSYFVEASYGSIYPALAKLEDDGLVTSRVEPQDGKPAKKVYSITDAGRAAFVDALHEPLDEEVFRSPFLLFARYAHLLPAGLVEDRAREQLERTREEIRVIKQASNTECRTPADEWVINYGLVIMELAEKHLRTHLHELVALARPEQDKTNAAE
jgi:DNA-binding PadR family transcriptional regulator